MTVHDNRIRILWIEDRPERGAQKSDLGDFSKYFKIVGLGEAYSITSVRSIEEYGALLEYHFSVLGDSATTKESSPFPVEIISADYDLSQYSPGSSQVGDKNHPADSDLASFRTKSHIEGADREHTLPQQQEESLLRKVDYGDYDGCIINTLYLSEFSGHPCGSVVTTYQEPSARHRCAKNLETHLRRCYQVDLIFSGTTRTWQSILIAGVKALRQRIETLHSTGNITILPSDLESMIKKQTDGFLTVQSSHALRKLPVQGLFIDKEADRDQAISDWATKLIEKTVGYDVYVKGKELAQAVWKAYCDTAWIQERRDLSKALANYSNEELVDLINNLQNRHCDEKKLINLWNKYKFQATQGVRDFKTTCNDSTCDIHSWGDFSKHSRRWAAILLIFWLFERILKKRIELAEEYRELMDREYNEDYPHITQDDIYFVLFPVPKTPLILPWDQGRNLNNESTWAANLKRLKDDTTGASLALSIEDVLNGHDWSESGPYGLMTGERCFLQGLCRESEVGEDMWREFGTAKRFIWGRKGQ